MGCSCSQFLPVDYGDLGDSPGVRYPPAILSACLDGHLSDVRDVSIQVNEILKDSWYRSNFQLLLLGKDTQWRKALCSRLHRKWEKEPRWGSPSPGKVT